jgi:hypothetical protein
LEREMWMCDVDGGWWSVDLGAGKLGREVWGAEADCDAGVEVEPG